MKKREFLSRSRLSGIRDPKLIIIATEGKCTEKQYFEGVQERKGKTNIHVHILNTKDGASSPGYVLERLDDFKKKYNLNFKKDQLWMVIDMDDWGEDKLSKIAKKCVQKKYSLAISNPCFEIWLLLHVCKWSDYSDYDKNQFKVNKRSGKRRTGKTAIEKELTHILGHYDKSNIEIDCFIEGIEDAINVAKRLDVNPSERWPSDIGTRVYLLVKEII